MAGTKKFLVEVEVAAEVIAAGFKLDDLKARMMVERILPYAHGSQFDARVVEGAVLLPPEKLVETAGSDVATDAEGWMGAKGPATRRYHYIVGSMALCRGLGFYRGDLQPHKPGQKRGFEDCAKCFKLVKARAVKP